MEKLSSLQFKGAIIGMILGDGSLSKRKNSFLRITSIIKDYLQFKANILSQLTKITFCNYITLSNFVHYID